MLLSGSVGYTLLENNELNKKILILADIHDGVNYCNNNSVMIDSWLDSQTNKSVDIYLEEVLREKFTLGDLWPNSIHTSKLKKLNQNNKKIIPIDIRPYLIPFSWELLINDKGHPMGQMTLTKYLMQIDDVFNFRSTSILMSKYITPPMQRMEQNCSDKIKELILRCFNINKEIYLEFLEDNKDLLDKKIVDISTEKLEELNNLISGIMEWYIVLLILSSKRNAIIHLGLAHSNRLNDLFIGVYNFKEVKSDGVNTIQEVMSVTNRPATACVFMPPEL